MNIVERGRAFLEGLRGLAGRAVWEWRRCPRCGDTETCKWGSYQRQPWFLRGRETVRVQRHRCQGCRRTYSEGSALLVRGGWYARVVRRSAIDQARSSYSHCDQVRRTRSRPGLVTRPIEGLSLERELVIATVSGSTTPLEIRKIAQLASRYEWQ